MDGTFIFFFGRWRSYLFILNFFLVLFQSYSPSKQQRREEPVVIVICNSWRHIYDVISKQTKDSEVMLWVVIAY